MSLDQTVDGEETLWDRRGLHGQGSCGLSPRHSDRRHDRVESAGRSKGDPNEQTSVRELLSGRAAARNEVIGGGRRAAVEKISSLHTGEEPATKTGSSESRDTLRLSWSDSPAPITITRGLTPVIFGVRKYVKLRAVRLMIWCYGCSEATNWTATDFGVVT